MKIRSIQLSIIFALVVGAAPAKALPEILVDGEISYSHLLGWLSFEGHVVGATDTTIAFVPGGRFSGSVELENPPPIGGPFPVGVQDFLNLVVFNALNGDGSSFLSASLMGEFGPLPGGDSSQIQLEGGFSIHGPADTDAVFQQGARFAPGIKLVLPGVVGPDMFASDFTLTLAEPIAIQAIPEPRTAVLVLVGIGFVALRRALFQARG